MASISSTDYLFATASIKGERFFNYAGQGITSLTDIVRMVKSHAIDIAGLVTISVRNTSKGWSQNRQIYLTSI